MLMAIPTTFYIRASIQMLGCIWFSSDIRYSLWLNYTLTHLDFSDGHFIILLVYALSMWHTFHHLLYFNLLSESILHKLKIILEWFDLWLKDNWIRPDFSRPHSFSFSILLLCLYSKISVLFLWMRLHQFFIEEIIIWSKWGLICQNW